MHVNFQDYDIYHDNLSEWMSIKEQVRQGCVASPHLFALYTDDYEGIRGHGGFQN